MADSFPTLLLGLLTGFLFGFLLQKAQVTRFPVIVGQMLLKDMTVVKTMLTAVVVGGIGVYVLKSAGLATLHVKPAQLASVILGGSIFGIGMVLLGYCPGTGIAAAAEGKKDAVFGVLGMLTGASIFAELFGFVSRTVNTWFDYGQVTLPGLLNVSPWSIFAVLFTALVVFGMYERKFTNEK